MFEKREDALKRFIDAVRIPTISYDEEERVDNAPFFDFHDFLKNAYPLMHLKGDVKIIDEMALLFRVAGREATKEPVLFLAHMDVVPASDESEWTHPPFAGVVDGDYLYGRGTLDMKGQLIAICEAVEDMLESGEIPDRDVYIGFGYDEERMRESSAAKMMRYLQGEGIRFMFVLDEGIALNLSPLDIDEDVVALCYAEKGYMDVLLTAHSEAGHASAPPRHTALGTLARGIVALEDNPIDRYEGDEITPLLDGIRALMDEPHSLLARMQADPKIDALLHTTIAPTMAEGAEMSNVLPRKASAVVNIRIAPWDTKESVLAHISKFAPKLEQEVLLYNPPVSAVPLECDAYRTVESSAKAAFNGAKIVPYVMTAATDSRYFPPICGAILRVTPFKNGEASRMHGVDERVRIDDFFEAIDFFKNLLGTI